MVGIDSEGALTLGLSDQVRPKSLAGRLSDARDGDIVEVRPAADVIASDIGARIAELGGLALVIDYGGQRSLGGHAAGRPGSQERASADRTRRV